MALSIRRVSYFKMMVQDRPGEAYQVLSALTGAGVNLLVFGAVPMGADHTELTLYPEDADRLAAASEKVGIPLAGPEPALLIQGDDQLGALADIHSRLYDARVNVFASTGVADGRGGFGYVVHVRPADFETAATALGV
jgi:hypothetical protein